MKWAILYEFANVITTYQNDDLFSQWSFRDHSNARFGIYVTIDNFMDLINFLNTDSWKDIFDFDNFIYITSLFRYLCIQFLGLVRSVYEFDILEVFGDLIDLLLQFGWN